MALIYNFLLWRVTSFWIYSGFWLDEAVYHTMQCQTGGWEGGGEGSVFFLSSYSFFPSKFFGESFISDRCSHFFLCI